MNGRVERIIGKLCGIKRDLKKVPAEYTVTVLPFLDPRELPINQPPKAFAERELLFSQVTMELPVGQLAGKCCVERASLVKDRAAWIAQADHFTFNLGYDTRFRAVICADGYFSSQLFPCPSPAQTPFRGRLKRPKSAEKDNGEDDTDKDSVLSARKEKKRRKLSKGEVEDGRHSSSATLLEDEVHEEEEEEKEKGGERKKKEERKETKRKERKKEEKEKKHEKEKTKKEMSKQKGEGTDDDGDCSALLQKKAVRESEFKLPPGWHVKEVHRKVANSRQTDKYYFSPTGEKFRSKIGVIRHLSGLATPL
eukprot:TRINITY_DN3570_c0_g1_i3.p1 TRINITY_DN3570_c0_g1~~TRINITY_DN3570_c0_g1_i3.p1  ORF type:complete len:309 (+),score=99.87 TRINITY_DN3570_c0_g1_i3:148-1074(+)